MFGGGIYSGFHVREVMGVDGSVVKEFGYAEGTLWSNCWEDDCVFMGRAAIWFTLYNFAPFDLVLPFFGATYEEADWIGIGIVGRGWLFYAFCYDCG